MNRKTGANAPKNDSSKKSLKKAETENFRLDRAPAENIPYESEEKYRFLLETIDEGFCIMQLVLDDDGRVVDIIYREANAAFEHHSGLSDMVGKRASELFPQLEQYWLEAVTRVHRTGIPERVEGYNVDMNRWISAQYSSVGGAGSPFVAALFNDITTLKLREKQQAFLLRFSDALRTEQGAEAVANRALRLLFEQLTLDRCYIGVYRLAEDRGEFPHQVGNERVPPLPGAVRLSDFPEALRVAFDRTLVIEDVAETEGLSDTDKHNFGVLNLRALVAASLRKGENNPLWSIVAVSATPRRWTPGEIALIEEVTERTWAAIEHAKAEESLRRSEEKYRTLFESIDEGFCIIEVIFNRRGKPINYRFLEANPAFYKQTGFENAIGRTVLEFVPDHEKYWFEIYGEIALTGVPVRFEQAAEALNRWYEVYAFRIGEPEERRVAVLFNDIAERKRAEKTEHEKEMLAKLVSAQEDERRRIARDLHDELGQKLTALRLKLDAVKGLCRDNEVLCDRIDETQIIAQSIDDGVDFLSWELRPAALDDLGLFAAVQKYVYEWSQHSGLTAYLRGSSLREKRFSREVETNLYRIVQEALNNVNKHAKAKNVTVIMKMRDESIVLIIEDDGKGFDPEDPVKRSKGIGIIGMQERAILIGGKLTIESAPGNGTMIHVRVPVKFSTSSGKSDEK